MELPVTETPILIGRAPEADVRVAEDGIRDFHVQVSRVPGGVQVIQLAADPPRRFVLADGAESEGRRHGPACTAPAALRRRAKAPAPLRA